MEEQSPIERSDILWRYIRGIASEEETAYVEKWKEEDSGNEKILEQVACIYYAQRTKERILKRDSLSAFEKVQQRKRRQKRRIYLRRAVSIAAGIAFIISLGVNSLLWNKTEIAETQYITVQTNAGMRTNLDLPDGTRVYLNSASKLTYPVPYDPKERKVLLEGEGYFEVRSNPEQPFIVSIANDRMRVKALGTIFNINAYPGEKEIYTTLVEGTVVLQYTDANRDITEKRVETAGEIMYNLSSRHIVMNEQKLIPAEKASYNLPTGKTDIRKVNTINEYAWKEGKLIFKDTPMPEVLSKLSNYYNVKFEIKNPVIREYAFTGTFDNKQLFQILDYFRHTSNINYTIRQVTEDDSNGVKYTTILLDR